MMAKRTRETQAKGTVARFAAAIGWLASPENKDAELRATAKAILDDLLFLRQMALSQPHGGASTSAETAEATHGNLLQEASR